MLAWLRRSGAGAGSLAALTFFLVSLALAKPASMAGVDLGVVRQIAEQHFVGHLAAFVGWLIVFTALFGAVAGMWARWVAGESRTGYWAAYLCVIVCLDARVMAAYPYLYAEHFHLRGGAAQIIQAIVTSLPSPAWALLPLGILSLHALRSRPPRLPARWLAVFVPVVLLPAAPAPEAPAAKPNILILAADSLRPDYLSPARTPNIAGLAQKGTYWSKTYVHTPRTFPAWAEMLTGRFGPRAGIRHMFPAAEERRIRAHSLVPQFGAAGYRTFVVSDYAGDIFPRFDAGFDDVAAPNFTFPALLDEQILRTQPWLFGALAWRGARRLFPVLREFADLADPAWLTADLGALLPDSADDKPFFGVAFYSVTHFPYAVPFPDYKAEADPGYTGPFRYGKPPRVGEEVIGAGDVRQIRALYAGGVRAFDREVGRVLQQLSLRGLDRNTIVVIAADHGENLYERPGDTGHGDHLAGDESLRIPFIIYDPTGKLVPGVRDGLAQSVDVLPTLLALAGVPAPAGTDGYSQAATTAPARRAAFAESGMWFANTNQRILADRRIDYPDILALGTVDDAHGDQIVLKSPARPLVLAAKHQAAFDAGMKVMYVPTSAGVRWEAYDRNADPLEAAPFAIPAPGAWPAKVDDRLERARQLQQQLVNHALAGGAVMTSAGWLLPGDGAWAP